LGPASLAGPGTLKLGVDAQLGIIQDPLTLGVSKELKISFSGVDTREVADGFVSAAGLVQGAFIGPATALIAFEEDVHIHGYLAPGAAIYGFEIDAVSDVLGYSISDHYQGGGFFSPGAFSFNRHILRYHTFVFDHPVAISFDDLFVETSASFKILFGSVGTGTSYIDIDPGIGTEAIPAGGPNSVPEPSTLATAAVAGLAGLGALWRRRWRNHVAR
jgi:hypothetical protein